MTKNKHKNTLSNSLNKSVSHLQKNFKQATALIPWKQELILTPAQPTGYEIDRFRNPEFALLSWPSKQVQKWSFCGNITSTTHRSFGFELVFKMRNTHLDTLGAIPARWLKPRIFAAHFALTDQLNANKTKSFRYWQKGGPLAPQTGFCADDKFHLELDGWYAKRNPTGTISVYASGGGNSASLHMTPSKPLTYHAQKGYFQFGSDSSDSSYFCSYTNLQTRGTILIDGNLHDVTGNSWLDHEKSTIKKLSLGSTDVILPKLHDQMMVHLPTNEELMIHLVQDELGKASHYSSGTLIDRTGNTTNLIATDFRIENLQYWKSRKSGARYPLKKRITIDSLGLQIDIKPFQENNELDTFKSSLETYWEGPVSVQGVRNGESFLANGFMELTGYAKNSKTKIASIFTG